MSRPISHPLWLAALAAFALITGQARASDATDSHTDLQWSVEVARGHYGEASTSTIVTMPFVVRHRQGRLTGQVEVPLVRIDSTERLVPGIGALDPGAVSERRTVAGLGDVWLKASYELVPADHGSTGLDLTLKIKTATGAVERGLGSGATDIALQLEAMRAFGPVTWFGHLGYRRTGDVAGFRPYADPWYAELGAMGRISPSCDLGAFYNTRQAIGRLGAVGEATLFGACRQDSDRVQLHLTGGHTDASPDLALGLTWRRRY